MKLDDNRWELMKGDLPSERTLRRIQEFKNIGDNAAFRMATKNGRDTLQPSLLSPYFRPGVSPEASIDLFLGLKFGQLADLAASGTAARDIVAGLWAFNCRRDNLGWNFLAYSLTLPITVLFLVFCYSRGLPGASAGFVLASPVFLVCSFFDWAAFQLWRTRLAVKGARWRIELRSETHPIYRMVRMLMELLRMMLKQVMVLAVAISILLFLVPGTYAPPTPGARSPLSLNSREAYLRCSVIGLVGGIAGAAALLFSYRRKSTEYFSDAAVHLQFVMDWVQTKNEEADAV